MAARQTSHPTNLRRPPGDQPPVRRHGLPSERLRRAGEAVLIVTIGYCSAAAIGIGLGFAAVANHAVFDAPAYAWLMQFRNTGSSLTAQMEFLTMFGDPIPSIVQVAFLTIIFALLFNRRWWLPAVILPLGLALEFSLQAFIGATVQREPPPGEEGTWFSGASARFVTLYGLSFFLLVTRWPQISTSWRIAGIVAVALLALGIGYTRLYLGHHWPTDIPAGWLIGALVTVSIIIAIRRFGNPIQRASNSVE